MAPLLVVILAGAFRAPWSSVATVDERTYLEMAGGIQQTGLPLVDNGPVDRFPALQARWNLFRDGRLWGSMQLMRCWKKGKNFAAALFQMAVLTYLLIMFANIRNLQHPADFQAVLGGI